MAKKPSTAKQPAATASKKPASKTSAGKTAAPSKTSATKSAATKSAATKSAATKSAAAKTSKSAAPAKGAKAAATAAPGTVTLKHLAVRLAEGHEMAKRQADAVVSDLVGMMVTHLKKGDRVRIGGLGILQVRHRAARMGRNPATGEAIKIKASKKIAFRAAKELKEAI